MARQGISNTTRFHVLNRDKFTCQYCGDVAGEGVKLEIDHIIAVANGGSNAVENLVTACQKCNNGKRDKWLNQGCAVLDKVPLEDQLREALRAAYPKEFVLSEVNAAIHWAQDENISLLFLLACIKDDSTLDEWYSSVDVAIAFHGIGKYKVSYKQLQAIATSTFDGPATQFRGVPHV